jgi:diguanylate cyclase (GGDEF)-like protein
MAGSDTENGVMQLDLPTLLVMQSFALACAGAILLAAWSQNRAITALALWGIAHIFAAGGFVSLMLGLVLRQPIWVVGVALLVLQASLVWKAARTIDSKRAPIIVVLVGPVVVGLVGVVGVVSGVQYAPVASLVVSTAYTLATATTLWLGRKDHLVSRWPLVFLLAAHAVALMIGIESTSSGSTGQNGLPVLTSLFGVIYFETIVFALGTSIFIIALIKERNEALGMKAARIDPLTGILNRGGFMERAERVIDRCRRSGSPVSVMMFDLDRFKEINDAHGHGVGDTVIRTFCEIMADALRPSDVFGRMGGEEFAVALPGSSIEAAHARAERIRLSFSARCRFVSGHRVEATACCGISVSVKAEETLVSLLENADRALYLAKSAGRNRVMQASQREEITSTVIRVA